MNDHELSVGQRVPSSVSLLVSNIDGANVAPDKCRTRAGHLASKACVCFFSFLNKIFNFMFHFFSGCEFLVESHVLCRAAMEPSGSGEGPAEDREDGSAAKANDEAESKLSLMVSVN